MIVLINYFFTGFKNKNDYSFLVHIPNLLLLSVVLDIILINAPLWVGVGETVCLKEAFIRGRGLKEGGV